MNKQILFLLILLFVTAIAGNGCPWSEMECNDFCILHITNSNGMHAKGGKCGGFLWYECQCTY